jgi:omega-amidase
LSIPDYAEPIPGETTNLLSQIAKELQIVLIGGTIPERDGDKLYNTATVWGTSGELLAKYRKMHLFDIDIPGEITFRESDSLSAGSDLATIDVKDFKIGLGICYDIRFEELAKIYRKMGCNVLVYPAAFNMKTGPLHYELLARSRSNDNQLFTALVSPARDESASYVAWGHSCVVDPWAEVLYSSEADEDVFVVDLDLDRVDKVRGNIPIYAQRRVDVYDTVKK